MRPKVKTTDKANYANLIQFYKDNPLDAMQHIEAYGYASVLGLLSQNTAFKALKLKFEEDENK